MSGSNFRNGATVLFGSFKASNVTVTKSGSIAATTPAQAAGGKVNVTINNTDGTTSSGLTSR
jgi:IPT/TIG domain